MQPSERHAFEEFCNAIQTYNVPLNKIGANQRFVHKRHHNKWSIAHLPKESLKGGAGVHRFCVYHGTIALEPLILVQEAELENFNEQVATATRGSFGRAFETRRRWMPKFW